MKVFQLKTYCHKLTAQTHIVHNWKPVRTVLAESEWSKKKYKKSLLEMSFNELQKICKQ